MNEKEYTGGSSTKELKRVLGFGDLLLASIGELIGPGIMTLLGAAIALTGRSVAFALLFSGIIIIAKMIPGILVSSTVRLRGGQYTLLSLLCGNKMLSGTYALLRLIQLQSLAMFAISFASYFISLCGFGNERIIALAILTVFFVLNLLGIDKFAKVQNIIVILVVIAMAIFTVAGLTRLEPDFFEKSSFLPQGITGFLKASALLTFAVSGADCMIDFSGEAKNAKRDIPRVIVLSTLIVAAMFVFLGIVASGVLPVDEVAGQNLSLVAQTILSKPLYIFFMVGGAWFAILSTMNAQMAFGCKAILQSCDDGWYPIGFGKLNKHKVPYRILTLLYVIASGIVISGMSIVSIGSFCTLTIGFTSLLMALFLWRLPKLLPKQWEASPYHVSNCSLYVLTVLSCLGCCFMIVYNFINMAWMTRIGNIVVVVIAVAFAAYRCKGATVQASYEDI